MVIKAGMVLLKLFNIQFLCFVLFVGLFFVDSSITQWHIMDQLLHS